MPGTKSQLLTATVRARVLRRLRPSPTILLYANDRRREAAYAEELQRMAVDREFDLKGVHVLRNPPHRPDDEQGLVSEGVI